MIQKVNLNFFSRLYIFCFSNRTGTLSHCLFSENSGFQKMKLKNKQTSTIKPNHLSGATLPHWRMNLQMISRCQHTKVLNPKWLQTGVYVSSTLLYIRGGHTFAGHELLLYWHSTQNSFLVHLDRDWCLAKPGHTLLLQIGICKPKHFCRHDIL